MYHKKYATTLAVYFGSDEPFVDNIRQNMLYVQPHESRNLLHTYLNKRPMGHIVHLRKQFKSIITYDYIITLIQRKKNHYKVYEKLLVFHLKKRESPSPKDVLCQDWLKLIPWFWRKGFFNIVNVF